MTRLTPALTSKKTINVSYATPRETVLDTPQTLPTSEPTNPQVIYTFRKATFQLSALSPIAPFILPV